MLEVFDRSRNLVGILHNAFNITEEIRLNALNTLTFALPADDAKNDMCQAFHIVRYDHGEAYRIVGVNITLSNDEITVYDCEHVLALLLGTVLYGYHVIGNLGIYTRDVISYVLNRQIQRDWTLDRCDFTRQFEYGWEQENLLGALFSIPNRFVDKYKWHTDTSVYPYKVSLLQIDESANPKLYARDKYNRLRLTKNIDYKKIITRIYPLGAGEGVNQLDIRAINNGLPYLQSDAAHIAAYGLNEYVWTDRRYTDVESLKAAAQTMLDVLQEPFVEYEVELIGKCDIGDIIELVGVGRNYVTGITISHGESPSRTYTISNNPRDVAGSIADIADRSRIEMTYSQGATQIYTDSLSENADSNSPAELLFFVPQEMGIINFVKLKVRISPFRSYSQATGGGGARSDSTSSGGGRSDSTNSGGGSTQTSSSKLLESSNTVYDPTDDGNVGGTNHNHGIARGVPLGVIGNDLKVVGTVSWTPSGKHTHPAHNHTVSIPSHSHGFTIPSHTHGITIPDHTHQITPVISFAGYPQGFTLSVNGNTRTFNNTDQELDISDMLIRPGSATISRGTWYTISIRPTDKAYIRASYSVQGFIQSRGNRTI